MRPLQLRGHWAIKAVNIKDRNFTRASLAQFIKCADAKFDDYLQRPERSATTEAATGGSRVNNLAEKMGSIDAEHESRDREQHGHDAYAGRRKATMTGMSRPATQIETAAHAARHWLFPEPGPLRAGTEPHKQVACRMFHETSNPYKPSIIDWPRLDPVALARSTGLPIWDIAVQTEGKARLGMRTYGKSLTDPTWREATERNAWEEGRHKDVLSNPVATYGIQLAPELVYRESHDPEWAYLVTGFSECVDSFFAFGLFEMAKRSGFFPSEPVDTFEPVIQEEARHILLFANWLAWHRRRLTMWRRIWFELRVAAVWVFLACERIGTRAA